MKICVGWINIFKMNALKSPIKHFAGSIYSTKEEAIESKQGDKYAVTIMICWEEDDE